VTADVFLTRSFGFNLRLASRPPELKFRLHTQHAQFTISNVDYAGRRSRVANPIDREFERSLKIGTPNLLTSLLKELRRASFRQGDRELGESSFL
jgi:hypothetical protein